MRSSEEKEIPAYTVHINTSAFAYKKCHLKVRIQTQWMGYFQRKCGMDQKRISPSCEDRLSQLTTGQIDRIIDMERIRTILHDKKRKKEEVYFNYQKQPNTHPHVYEANFLAKINAIAIKRNIRHEKSQGFDEYFGQQLEKSNGQKDKKATQLPYKYIKKYQMNAKRPHNFTAVNIQEDDQKSIDSIEDKLQDFEHKVEQSRVQRSKKDRQKLPQCSAMRWFNGMSNHYLRKGESQGSTLGDFQRMPSFDIQSQVKQSRRKTSQIIRGKKQPSQNIRSQPFVKFKINRINRMISVK